jgi:hypothetical protein
MLLWSKFDSSILYKHVIFQCLSELSSYRNHLHWVSNTQQICFWVVPLFLWYPIRNKRLWPRHFFLSCLISELPNHLTGTRAEDGYLGVLPLFLKSPRRHKEHWSWRRCSCMLSFRNTEPTLTGTVNPRHFFAVLTLLNLLLVSGHKPAKFKAKWFIPFRAISEGRYMHTCPQV